MRLSTRNSNCPSLPIVRQAMCVGAAALALSGCYRPYYYAPPMQTYQGPVAPIQTLTPGPSYVPGQAAPGGLQPIPANPSLGTGSSEPFYGGSGASNNSPQSTFDTPEKNPVYNPATGAGSNGVPNYPDPTDDLGDFLQPDIRSNDNNGNPVEQFKVPGDDPQAMLNDPAITPTPFAPVAEATPMADEQTPLDEPFDLSLLTPTSEPTDASAEIEAMSLDPIEQTAFTVDPESASDASRYGHEAGTYAWLRGVVQLDPEDGQWTITYDVSPNEFDEFAGHLTLATDERLKNFRNNDFVLIEGRVNTAKTDRFGKPCYEISNVAALESAVR